MTKTIFVGKDPAIAVDLVGEGELAFFLHGVGGNKRNWVDNLPHFGSKMRAAAWDIRGYGESDDYEGPLIFEEVCRDLLGILDHLEVDKAHLVGLSMGSEVAPIFADLYSSRVRTLTLCATLRGSALMTDVAKAEFLDSRRKPLLAGKSAADIAGPVARSLLGPSATAEMLAQLQDSISRLRTESYLKTIEAELRVDNTEILKRIRVPTHVVCGEFDPITPVADGREVAELVTGSRLTVVKDAGHLINIEQPAQFNEVVLSFLLQHSGNSALFSQSS